MTILVLEGRVIGISSAAGVFGVMGYSAYCPSKHAVVALYQVKNLAYGVDRHVLTSVDTELATGDVCS